MKAPLFRSLGERLSYVEGTVRFYGVPIQTRMAVSKLAEDSLWVWSPLPFTDEIGRALDALGFSEVVFFHRASSTLIVADLVENICASTLPTKTGRVLAKTAHIYGRALPSPEFRMSLSMPRQPVVSSMKSTPGHSSASFWRMES